jgi:hypothetical protein
MFHDEPISDSNHSADALDDNWVEDGQDADVSVYYTSYITSAAPNLV